MPPTAEDEEGTEATVKGRSRGASSGDPYGVGREEDAPGLDAFSEHATYGAWSLSRAWAAVAVLVVGCGVVFSLSAQI